VGRGSAAACAAAAGAAAAGERLTVAPAAPSGVAIGYLNGGPASQLTSE